MNVDLQWTYCFKTINVSIDWVVIQYLISLWEKNIFNRKYTKECFCFVCFYNCEQHEMNHLCCLFSTKNTMRTLEFCTRMYTRSTMKMGLKLFSTTKLFPFWCCVLKRLCGIDLLSFNNLLCCILNPIDNLINRRRICLMWRVATISFVHGRLTAITFIFRVRIRGSGRESWYDSTWHDV